MQCNAARHDPRDRACAVRCAAQLLSLATLLDAKYDAVHLNAKYPQVYPLGWSGEYRQPKGPLPFRPPYPPPRREYSSAALVLPSGTLCPP